MQVLKLWIPLSKSPDDPKIPNCSFYRTSAAIIFERKKNKKIANSNLNHPLFKSNKTMSAKQGRKGSACFASLILARNVACFGPTETQTGYRCLNMQKRKDVLTTGQVAQICNVAPRTVTKWFDSGRLKGYRIPGSKDRKPN